MRPSWRAEARPTTEAPVVWWGRLQPAEGFSPTFFGFLNTQGTVLKPDNLSRIYLKRWPKRPPAGKTACRTRGMGRA